MTIEKGWEMVPYHSTPWWWDMLLKELEHDVLIGVDFARGVDFGVAAILSWQDQQIMKVIPLNPQAVSSSRDWSIVERLYQEISEEKLKFRCSNRSPDFFRPETK